MNDIQHGRGAMASLRTPACLCGAVGARNEAHDAYYCPVDGVWLEAACGDPDCEFCVGRPDKFAVDQQRKQ